MFPDRSFDLEPFKSLTHYLLLHNVLLPQTVIHLIQEDLPNLSRIDAIDTMKSSAHYGNILHYNEDSPAVRDVVEKLAAVIARNQALYDEYERSGSSLGFNQWVRDKRQSRSGLSRSAGSTSIKQEEMPNILKSVDPGDVIDLTIDEVVKPEQTEGAIRGMGNDLNDNVIDLTLDD